MDSTTVDDRHRVPSGWLSVRADAADDAEIEVYPTSPVLAGTDLREVA